ncbi:hypothetical protein GGR36_002772 [Niveibacterium umoris]|uniref:Uncharacterized protein n=1 Tax=Niveibacterium umoris TaxID=1193620 RepID=A0A840BRJ3_9RHOO|nr:hypothetical protein [Niveibacterium umoris]
MVTQTAPTHCHVRLAPVGDGSGDVWAPLPDVLLRRAHWRVGDRINVHARNEEIVLKRVRSRPLKPRPKRQATQKPPLRTRHKAFRPLCHNQH